MYEVENILISVEDRHVLNMLNGVKTVELRRRPLRVPVGSRVWIYSKVPRGEVSAHGVIEHIENAPPAKLWARYGAKSGIKRAEFFDYFEGIGNGCAIVFKEIHGLHATISLEHVRKTISSFHPPQFFKFLKQGSPELELFLLANPTFQLR